MKDLATYVVHSHNETLAQCAELSLNGEYFTYRPYTPLIQSRNAYLNQVMHYRPHQQEY